MRKTSVAIDDALVKKAQLLLGTSSLKETINSALREVLRREARREEIRSLAEMAGLDLSDDKIMTNAWRS